MPRPWLCVIMSFDGGLWDPIDELWVGLGLKRLGIGPICGLCGGLVTAHFLPFSVSLITNVYVYFIVRGRSIYRSGKEDINMASFLGMKR